MNESIIYFYQIFAGTISGDAQPGSYRERGKGLPHAKAGQQPATGRALPADAVLLGG